MSHGLGIELITHRNGAPNSFWEGLLATAVFSSFALQAIEVCSIHKVVLLYQQASACGCSAAQPQGKQLGAKMASSLGCSGRFGLQNPSAARCPGLASLQRPVLRASRPTAAPRTVIQSARPLQVRNRKDCCVIHATLTATVITAQLATGSSRQGSWCARPRTAQARPHPEASDSNAVHRCSW